MAELRYCDKRFEKLKPKLESYGCVISKATNEAWLKLSTTEIMQLKPNPLDEYSKRALRHRHVQNSKLIYSNEKLSKLGWEEKNKK